MYKPGEGKRSLLDTGLKVAFGTIIGMVITLVILCVAAMVIYSGKLAEGIGDALVLASSFIGACIGSVIVAKRQGRSVLAFGALSGASYFVLILVFTAFGGYAHVFWDKLIKIGICSVMGGLLGGVICMPRGKRRKARRGGNTGSN